MNRKPDSDFECAFNYNQPQPFAVDDVVDMKAAIPGHNDEDSWYWICELRDGRFFLVTASCDYTGWDCRSSCDCIEGASAIDCANKVIEQYSKRGIKEQLILQLQGKQPFGLEVKQHMEAK